MRAAQFFNITEEQVIRLGTIRQDFSNESAVIEQNLHRYRIGDMPQLPAYIRSYIEGVVSVEDAVKEADYVQTGRQLRLKRPARTGQKPSPKHG